MSKEKTSRNGLHSRMKEIESIKEVLLELNKISQTQRQLIKKVEEIENLTKGVLSHIKPKKEKVIPLTEILRYPDEYEFNFLGKNKTLWDLIKEKRKKEEVEKKLNLSTEDYWELGEGLYLPDEKTSKKLLQILGISKWEFTLFKANAYRNIKNSPDEILRPYLHLDIYELFEEMYKKGYSGNFYGFVVDLFVKNCGNKILSSDPNDYKNKNREEIKRILELRKYFYLLEYPTFWNYSSKQLEFKISPEDVIGTFYSMGGATFLKLDMGDKPKFYRVEFELGGPNYVCIKKDSKKTKFEVIPYDEMFKMWKNSKFEAVIFYKGIIKDVINDMASNVRQFGAEDIWYDISSGSSSLQFLWEDDVLYLLFKSKWISEEFEFCGERKKSIDYVVEPPF